MSTDLEKLEARLRNLQVEARREHVEHLAEFEAHRDDVQKKFEGLKTAAGNDSWVALKVVAEEALTTLWLLERGCQGEARVPASGELILKLEVRRIRESIGRAHH